MNRSKFKKISITVAKIYLRLSYNSKWFYKHRLLIFFKIIVNGVFVG